VPQLQAESRGLIDKRARAAPLGRVASAALTHAQQPTPGDNLT